MTVETTQPSEEWLARAVLGNYAERPDANALTGSRIWSYTDALSYAPGEPVRLHSCTNAKSYDLIILRDGLRLETVLERRGLPGKLHPIPKDCSIKGCGWPVALEFEIGADWPSGVYIVRTQALQDGVVADTHDHLLIVQPLQDARTGTASPDRRHCDLDRL